MRGTGVAVGMSHLPAIPAGAMALFLGRYGAATVVI